MSYTQTEILGFAKNFLELVEEARDILEKGGLRTDDIRRIVSKKYERAADANARQEEKKRELSELTGEVLATHDDLYRTTSGLLDACMGAAGKGSKVAKNFQRLRSRIRMPGDQVGKAVTVEPNPEASA